MKGLLLKDAYQMWSYTRWIILASVAMILMAALDHLSRNLWIVLGKLPDILPQFHTLFRLKIHNIRPLLRRERSGLRLGHGGQSRRLQFFLDD